MCGVLPHSSQALFSTSIKASALNRSLFSRYYLFTAVWFCILAAFTVPLVFSWKEKIAHWRWFADDLRQGVQIVNFGFIQLFFTNTNLLSVLYNFYLWCGYIEVKQIIYIYMGT